MLRKGNQGKSSEPILSDLQLTGAVNRSGSLESQDTGAEPPEGEARAIHCDEAEYLQFSGSTSPLRVEQQHFGGYSSSSSFACEAEAVSERCLQVILEHEEEAASLSPAILLQRLKEVQSGRQGDASYPDDYAPADCPRVGQTTNEGPQTSQPVDGVAFDVDKTTFRHKPHVESERNRAETQQDSQVQEQDIALYATRTTAILLLSGPSPVRLDDLRRCWMASPMLLRKRNLTALILNRTAGIAASCFGLHLLSFLTKGEHNFFISTSTKTGVKYVVFRQDLNLIPHLRCIRSTREEELRGFLLFLSTQFLCLQAELPLRTLKSSLWSVGRQDLLRDFDDASLLKAVQCRELPQKLDSLVGLISECESLKYIVVKRRPSAVDEDTQDSVFLAPTGRLLHELNLNKFRRECKEAFGLQPPGSRLVPPDRDESDALSQF